MRNILLLTKNYFLNLIGSFSRQFNKQKYIIALLFIGIIGTLLVGVLTYNSYVTVTEFIKLSPNDYLFAPYSMFLNIVTLLLIVLISLIMKCSSMDTDTDFELLLSMPFKKYEIIISKTLVSYLFDLGLYFLLFIPSVIVYYLLVKTSSILIVINSIIIVLILPLITNGLEFILNFFLNKLNISKKIESIVQIVLMVILLFFVLMFNFYINNVLIQDATLSFNDLLNKVVPIKVIYNYIMNNNLFNLLIIISLTLILFTFGLFLKAKNLGKKKKEVISKKEITYEEKTIFFNLFKKEANRYFTTPLYVMNTIFGIFLVIGASIYIMIQGRSFLDDIIFQLFKLDSNHTPILILFAASAIFSTVCTTYCSISIEGKNLWELKSLPINEVDIFKAKIMFNFVLVFIGAILADIFICIVLGFKYFLLYLVYHAVFGYFISVLGLYLNLLFPKTDYKSMNALVKQNMSLVLVMTIGSVFSIINLVVYLFIGKTFMFLILLCMLIIISIILTNKIFKKGIKQFRKIN